MQRRADESIFISIIIPAYNREKELHYCLEQVNLLQDKNLEVIVVDNNSTDSTRLVAEKMGVTVFTYSESQNANACRNFGASKANGNILVFLDSDVIPAKGLVESCVKGFSDDSVSALIGTYTVKHRNPNVSSQYKNYWIRYSYIKSSGHVGWMFGAVSAIRKSVFDNIAGFRNEFHARDGIDDIELGTRLTKAGYKVVFSPTLEVEHLKSYNIFSLLQNQFDRSAGFFTIAVATNTLSKSLTAGVFNVYPAFIYSTVLAPLFLAGWGASLFIAEVQYYWVLPATIYGAINIPFISSYFSHHGYWETAKIVPIIFLDHLMCSIGAAAGLLRTVGKSLGRVLPKANKTV